MPNVPTDQLITVTTINSLLPALVQALNEDERLPWAQGLTVDKTTVSSIPSYFVTSDAARIASRSAASYARGQVVRASHVGTRLIITQILSERGEMLADFTFHNEANGTLGIAAIEFNDAGELTRINTSYFYHDGAKLERDTSGYIASMVCLLMMSASENPASGVTCTKLDGVDVYEYKHALDSDDEHQQSPVQYSPRVMPRIRNDLAKELRHFPTRPNMSFNQTTINYFKEIADSIEHSSEMWWVSEDMSKLAWDVAISGTEPDDLDEKELPAPSGIMWLNGGGGPALLTKRLPDAQFFETGETPSELLSINAIAWYTPSARSSGIEGLDIGKPRFMGLTASPALAHDSTQWDSVLSPLDVESNLIDSLRIPTYVTFYNLKFLPRKLALIIMRLAREESLGEKREETIGNSAGGGRKKAKNKKIETVTCALLRRREYASESEREAEAREYSHRWIVRGHMRNQPVGPRNAIGGQRHERVWIAPYIKGPEDKPLVLKDRVQVWR